MFIIAVHFGSEWMFKEKITMNSQSVFLAMLLVGCSAPTTVVRPSPPAHPTMLVEAESRPKPCPPTEQNRFGLMMNIDYAKFVCLGASLATCYKEKPIWQAACGYEAADQIIRSSAHCRVPAGAKSIFVIQGSYIEIEEAVAGHYFGDVTDRMILVCGTPLPTK